STPVLSVSGKTVLLKGMRLRNANLSFAAGDGRSILGNTNNGHGAWFEIPAPVTMTDPGNGLCPGYSNSLLGSSDGKAAFLLATDWNASAQCRGYHAWGPLDPVGGLSSVEGARVFVTGSRLHVFMRSPGGDLRHWFQDPGAPPAAAERWGGG